MSAEEKKYQSLQETYAAMSLVNALMNDDNRLIEQLISYKYGSMALMKAIETGAEKAALELIRRGRHVGFQDEKNRTPLLYALMQTPYSKSIVNALLENGDHLDAQGGDIGQTALMLAAGKGDTEILDSLLAKGVDVNIQDTGMGYNALMFALQCHKIKSVEKLAAHPDMNLDAFFAGNTITGNMTALMQAATLQNAQAADILLTNGANPNTQNDMGYTALMLSVEYACMNQEDAQINARQQQRSLDFIKALLAHQADVNKGDKAQQTALMRAAGMGFEQAIPVLLEAGADIDKQDTWGLTALMWAVEGGHIQIAKTLINRGADVLKQTPEGRTALSIAQIDENEEMIQLLQSETEKAEKRKTSTEKTRAISLLDQKTGER